MLHHDPFLAETDSPDPTLDPAVVEELAWEEQAMATGAMQYRRSLAALNKRGLTGRSEPGKAVMRRLIEPFAEGITRALERESTRNKAGRRQIAYDALYAVPPRVAAMVATGVVLDLLASRGGLQSVAVAVGRGIEQEVRLTGFQREAPELYANTLKQIQNSPIKHVKGYHRGVLNNAVRKFGLAVESWDRRRCLHTGMALLNILADSTGLFVFGKVRKEQGPGRPFREMYVYLPTDELTKFMADYSNMAEGLATRRVPLLIPPKRWTSINGGGFHLPAMQRPLIRSRFKGVRAAFRSGNVKTLLMAVNLLQEVAWRVNRPLLEQLRPIFDSGITIKDFPLWSDRPMPEKPPEGADETTVKAWKMHAAEVFRSNRRDQGRRARLSRVVSTAHQLVGRPRIWFAYKLDFRGRMYPDCSFMHPQGDDLSKALLEFAVGEPLDERGLFWLRVHLANNFGVDKVSFEDRVAWTKQHEAMILACARDPVEHAAWAEADKPWQFLAACMAYAQWKADPKAPIHLPVSVDGSCNGIQHFSAMSRDEAAGREVNLIPQPKPADIYTRVADALTARLKALQPETSADADMRDRWLSLGISRSCTKRPVMVLPYGGTKDSARAYVLEYVQKLTDDGKPHPFRGCEVKASTWLAKHLWATMAEVIRGPRVVMDWLQELAKIANKAKVPLRWTTPCGMPVLQAYPDAKRYRVRTKIQDREVLLQLREDEPRTLSKREQVNGIAPNFVHSLDAAALVETIIAMQSMYLPDPHSSCPFGAVHDSYATLPNRVDALQRCLRQCFANMYLQHDVLAAFRRSVQSLVGPQVELPPVPERGTLDLRVVQDSQFFFA